MTGAPVTEAGAGGHRAAASAAILDTYTITSHDHRKMSRIYRRLTELEFLMSDLLRAVCFITLTSAKALPDEDIRRAWHRVQAWLMRHGYRCYLVTSAIQGKRRAKYGDSVLHYHLIVFGHARVPAIELRKVWGLGATYHERARNPTHAIRYIASYMRGNSGRLSWSYAMRDKLPGGFAPHTDSFRYVRADPLNGFPGGVIDFGWGGVHSVREGYVYVPAIDRIVPAVATPSHTLLWTAYRMSIDWQAARQNIAKGVRAENEWIDNYRLGELIASDSALPRLQRTVAMSDTRGNQ